MGRSGGPEPGHLGLHYGGFQDDFPSRSSCSVTHKPWVPSGPQARDASRTWTNVRGTHPVVPMAPAPTCWEVSAAPVTAASTAPSAAWTAAAVSPVSVWHGRQGTPGCSPASSRPHSQPWKAGCRGWGHVASRDQAETGVKAFAAPKIRLGGPLLRCWVGHLSWVPSKGRS